jgi:hypothetical protein
MFEWLEHFVKMGGRNTVQKLLEGKREERRKKEDLD